MIGLFVAILVAACSANEDLTRAPSPEPTIVPSVETPSPSVVAPTEALAIGLDGRIIFARSGGAYGDETLFIVGADGTGEKQLTDNGSACCLRFSPDGTEIMYSTGVGPRITTAIQDLATGAVRRIPLPDDTANLGAGAWSPDGKRLALQLWDDTDHSRDGLYTLRASDGGGLKRLTDPAIVDIPGDYAPDGATLIVFRESDVQGVGTLWSIPVAGGDPKQVSPDGMQTGFGSVRFSPDGKRVAFQDARTASTGALWTMRPDGDDVTKVFEDEEGRFVSHPTWSPDGSMLLFVLNPVADDFQHLPNALYVIDADGANLRLVLGGNDFKRELEWRTP